MYHTYICISFFFDRIISLGENYIFLCLIIDHDFFGKKMVDFFLSFYFDGIKKTNKIVKKAQVKSKPRYIKK